MRELLSSERVWLGLVVLGALALRLIDAGARLNHDEGYSWLVASAPDAGAFLSRLARFENTPPLFYALLAPLPLDHELWLRLPSILAGTALIPVLYAIVRPLLGSGAALLAAVGLAVAPFAVSYSDYSRGFMLAGLGLLLALLAAQRLALGGSRRWWAVYALAGAAALYSEYYAALYLPAIIGALLVLGAPRRRESVTVGAIPFVAFLPWIPQLVRSMNELGKTKLSFASTSVSFPVVRDAVVPLFFGEHGSAQALSVRSAQAILVLVLLAVACAWLYRKASREAFWLLGGVLLAALLLHLVASAVETNVFQQRYMTTVIALAAAVMAGAIGLIRWRALLPITAAALALLGIAIAVRRAGREYEPDTPGAVAIAASHGQRTILTNSAVVAFYGRKLHVRLDRPFGLGHGIERTCAPRCVVIDDERYGGARTGPGATIDLGPLSVRFPPREREPRDPLLSR